CNVKFETNGGSSISNKSVRRGVAVEEPSEPTKEGYEFKGWYTDKDLTKKYNFSTPVTKAMTLYAKWEEIDAGTDYEPDVEAGEENEEETEVEDGSQIVLTIGNKDAVVFGEIMSNDVAPKIVNDRTMLPIRFIAEALGAEVKWNADTRKVTIVKDDIEIIITIDSDKAIVNNTVISLDSPAFIESDRTYLPLRFVSENLGAKVEWKADRQQVVITK
ncbi:MAG: hypothetical protein E7417_02135, partial [Ruminococcaceae bacterium]|nr:hypothetical protein [Oscillospiraceae bacterium]